MPSLADEIKQTKPFPSLEEEVMVGIARTAALFEHGIGDLLRPHDLTHAQYNVLRILRGAGEAGLCRYEIRDRLVAPGPDVTRLLDRLESAGLVARERDAVDRRLVTTRITPAGLELVEALDRPVADYVRGRLAHLGKDRLRALSALLDAARTPD